MSFEEPEVSKVTDRRLGCVGVDLNVDHLALTEIDRFGNPIKVLRLNLNLYGKTKNQAKALIGDAVKTVVAYAKKAAKPIVIEKLDFQAKKRSLKGFNAKYSRMLSSFAYSHILEAILEKVANS